MTVFYTGCLCASIRIMDCAMHSCAGTYAIVLGVADPIIVGNCLSPRFRVFRVDPLSDPSA
jgi:hypothetical protein